LSLTAGNFNSARRTLDMFSTLFRLRAAGLQRSSNSQSGVRRAGNCPQGTRERSCARSRTRNGPRQAIPGKQFSRVRKCP
jgi:hypothetical protein